MTRTDAEPSPLIDVPALMRRLGEPGLRLIDARFDLADPSAGRQAFLAAHLPGAVHADLDGDLSDHGRPSSEGRHPLPDAARFARTLAGWGITAATPVVVYDAGGGAMAAARAWWLLRWMGHPDVRVLDGGVAAWQADRGPLETGEPTLACGGLVGGGETGWTPGRAPLATLEDVAAPPSGHLLVDARAPERFRGEVEPLDPRAGHIPGARNRPFAANLHAGRFKSPARLREEWRSVLGDSATPILYCGSGVTACHNALALVTAGWPMPMLFAPSWSGWVSDPSRPVATGH